MAIYVFRVQNGQEKWVSKYIYEKTESSPQYNGVVLSTVLSEKFKGYLFIEATDLAKLEIMLSSIRGINRRAVQGKPIDIEELSQILTPKPAVEGLKIGDLVEITNGPFKNSRGKIIRVDNANQEVTAELVGSAMSLPIKIHADFVRKISSI